MSNSEKWEYTVTNQDRKLEMLIIVLYLLDKAFSLNRLKYTSQQNRHKIIKLAFYKGLLSNLHDSFNQIHSILNVKVIKYWGILSANSTPIFRSVSIKLIELQLFLCLLKFISCVAIFFNLVDSKG